MPAPGNPSGFNWCSYPITANSSESTDLVAQDTTASEIHKDPKGRVTPTPGENRQQVDCRGRGERRQARNNKQEG